MNVSISRFAAAALCLVSGTAFANGMPLSPNELAQCAQRVHTLRSDAPRLTEQSVRLEQRRALINHRGDQLKLSVANAQRDDLKSGLDLHSRRQQHNAEATAFNAEMERFKQQVNALNVLKNDYDRSCSQRPFRRSELMALPEPQRRAMQTGLADIVVPYIDGPTGAYTLAE